ncbi:diguanylate cyclase [Sulfolobus sp. S-194]|uniref:NifB/NifX family molybdenum-iron cluster-binding protein n=1 Tax=Sulfolobus sp. S-194 TaxID=2512240 RepID=UPI0014373DE4|nr:NifB/NifX family molybdenum-iron cluster-binding protein [Sulfolobus sp. S-194]QIW25383.1 diguanylate cyclase [Sulfolobus sp. S-194]
MRIAIPVTNGYVEGPGEALKVQIYEVEGQEYKLIEEYDNPALKAMAVRGAHMLKSAIDRGVNAVIVAEMGPPGLRLLQNYKIKAYLAEGLDVKTAIEKFIKGELPEIIKPTHEEHHHHHYY